jgi:CheY-like chemotaxis protein
VPSILFVEDGRPVADNVALALEREGIDCQHVALAAEGLARQRSGRFDLAILEVSRTLKGEYGARTTREAADQNSSVMYVAAPILRNDAIVGVVSVGKPIQSFQSFQSFQGFIDLTRAKAGESAIWLFALAMPSVASRLARKANRGQR